MPSELASLVDVLVVNAVEAEDMCGIAVDDLPSALAAARRLSSGFGTVVVTAGGAGVAGLQRRAEPSALPALPVSLVSTHGAGTSSWAPWRHRWSVTAMLRSLSTSRRQTWLLPNMCHRRGNGSVPSGMTITFLGAVDLVAHCKFQPAASSTGCRFIASSCCTTVTYRLTAGNHDRVHPSEHRVNRPLDAGIVQSLPPAFEPSIIWAKPDLTHTV